MQRTRLPFVILAVGILAFTVAVSVIGFWKYAHFRYQGLDLAIYTNVLASLARGDGWYSSIQGSSYLGDHVEPVLLILTPLFRLWSDPRLLVVVQALALGLTALPVYSVCSSSRTEPQRSREIPRRSIGDFSTTSRRGRDSGRHDALGRRGAIALAMLWLLNPLLWNAALFEFHALSFAPLFLLSAVAAYVRRRFWWFLAFCILSLSVREDVALVVVMFASVECMRWFRERHAAAAGSGALLGTVDDRAGTVSRSEIGTSEGGIGASEHAGRASVPEEGTRPQLLQQRVVWVLVPLLLGSVWFLLVTRIAAGNSPSGAYKFLIYYGWLRDAVTHPLALVAHLFSLGNLDMAIGLLLPFLFLPLLHLRWLLLAVPPLLQIILAAPGGSAVVVETHYALAFVAGFVPATIGALREWLGDRAVDGVSGIEHRGSWEVSRAVRCRRWFERRLPLPPRAAAVLAVGTVLGAALVIGPFPGIARLVTQGASANDHARRIAYEELLARVPPDAPIAASYAALPHVAARRGAYALHAAYLGVTQYALAPYELPADVRYMLMDRRDAVAYAVQFPTVGWAAPHAAGGAERLQRIIRERSFGVVAERNDVVLLARKDVAPQNFGGLQRGATGPPLDEWYLRVDSADVRGRLTIDDLRDVTVHGR